MTHTSKISGSAGFFFRRSLCLLQLYCYSFSDGLGNEAAHPVGGFSPHIPGDVGVGVQGEARAVVAQDIGHRLDVHPLLDGQGRERMPLRYNNDKPENPSNDGRFEGLSHLFHSFSNHEKAGQKS